jgi:hypothetical protein
LKDAAAAFNRWTVLADVQDSAWVLVRVEGGVLETYNPACGSTPPAWGCSSSGPPRLTGPFLQSGAGMLDIWRTYEDGSGNLIQLLPPLGVSEPQAMEGIALLSPTDNYTLSGRRRFTAEGAWDPLSGTSVGQWLLTDQQTITVTKIPPPLQVTESAPDSDGVRTYTAEPLFGLSFRVPYDWGGWAPAGAARWAFYPGDSLPDRPDHSWPGWQIPECDDQAVCRWNPPVAGRMQLRAYIETRAVDVRSTGGEVRTLRLTCNGVDAPDSVVIERGRDLDCVASSKPAGGTVSGEVWAFSDSLGHSIPGPRGEDEWGGRMVVSGSISLTASVDGQSPSPSLTMRIHVSPRDWHGKLQFPDTVVIQSQKDTVLPYPPITRDSTELHDGDLGKFKEPGFLASIGSGDGPNAGWRFLAALPQFTGKSEIHLNAGLDPRDPFWSAQTGVRPGTVFTRNNACGTDFMQRARREVRAHEIEHFNRAKTWYESPEAADRLEGMVKYGEQPVQFDSTDWARVMAPLEARQAAWDAENYLRVTCVLQPLPF